MTNNKQQTAVQLIIQALDIECKSRGMNVNWDMYLETEKERIETAYNKDLFPNGILGLNADYVNQYVQYVADRRLEELGLEKHYNAANPAKWMATATDVYELVNFFEAQNTSYEVDTKAHNHATEKKADSAE